jgi:hypothetical protein
MKALHNINTMEREHLYLQKVNIHLFINLVIIQNVTSRLHAIWTSGRNGTRLSKNKKKQSGHENLILMPQVTSEVTSNQDTC